MPLADAAYDIKLNGGGFILVEESYRKKAQPPLNPRFSTGDYGLFDLSFWQFLAQEDFGGGEGQQILSTLNKYKDSTGWNMRTGKPRFGPQVSALQLTLPLPAPAQDVSGLELYDDFSGVTAGDALTTPIVVPTFGLWTDSGGDHTPTGMEVMTKWYDNNLATFFGFASGKCLVGSRNAVIGTFTDTLYATQIQAYGAWSYDVCIPLGANIPTPLSTNFVNFFFLMIDNSNYYRTKIFGANANTLSLVKCVAGVETVLATQAITALRANTGGTMHTIGVSRDSADGTITISVNGVVKITHLDNTHTTSTKMGLQVGTTGTAAPYTSGTDGNYTNFIAAVSEVKIPKPTSPTLGLATTTLQYNNELWICYPTNDDDFTITQLYTGSLLLNQPTIRHINAAAMCLVSRDGPSTGGSAKQSLNLVAVKGVSIAVYEGTSQIAGPTKVPTTTYVWNYTSIVQVSRDILLLMGTDTDDSGRIVQTQVNLTGTTWGVSSSVEIMGDGNGNATEGVVSPYAAIDSSGVIYYATLNANAFPGRIPSRLIRVATADQATGHTAFSQVDVLNNFSCRGCFSMQGTVYLFGAIIENGVAYNAIIKTDGTVVYRPIRTGSATSGGVPLDSGTANQQYNYGIVAVYKGLYSTLFLTKTEYGDYDVILELTQQGQLREVAMFNSGIFASAAPNPVAIFEWAGKFYCIDPLGGNIYEANNTLGGQATLTGTGTLRLSDYGGNTPLVNKSLFKVIIELSDVLSSGVVLTVVVNGTTFGTMTSADGTRKEISCTQSFVGPYFSISITYDRSKQWTGDIERIFTQFIPTQLKKRAWGFGLRATKNLKLADGSREQRTTLQQFDKIEAAWESDTPITFIDVDGESYTVIVTDFDQRRPLIQRKGGTSLEAFYFVELLET